MNEKVIPAEAVEAALPWWDNIAAFIKYPDRYDFVGPSGEVVKTMTPEEFEAWKNRT